jgi:hypothetical protein
MVALALLALQIAGSQIARALGRYPRVAVVARGLRTWRDRHVLFACRVQTAAWGTERAWGRVPLRLLLLVVVLHKAVCKNLGHACFSQGAATGCFARRERQRRE